jgi:hypothetical protein
MVVMNSSAHRPWRPRVVLVALALGLASAPSLGGAETRGASDREWEALHRRSRDALAGLAPPAVPALAPPRTACEPGASVTRPKAIVVGFTGGLEGAESGTSGVVRLRREIDERFGAGPEVAALTYSNFRWRGAARDVAALAGLPGTGAPAGTGGCGPAGGAGSSQPVIVVYGHSWGAGAIGKFARELRRDGLHVTLAVYIDAFTVRRPRVPDNVRFAVNLYQRTGLLRGFPLRGKRTLVAESSASTVVLASLRVTPHTDRFGWNWNLVQPLLFRHHHRIGHDERIREYLLELIEINTPPTSVEPGA